MSLDWSGIPQLSPADALKIVDGGKGKIVDVREPDEVKALSLTSSNVCFSPTTKLSEATSADQLVGLGIPADLGMSEANPLFCMCRRGIRGQNMATKLKQLGKTHVANLTGGIENCSATKSG